MPPYYPSGARLERTRVRVRVVAERQKFALHQAREREQARLQGLQDGAVPYAYSHRLTAQGVEEQQDKARILDWDTDVRGRIHRGVVIGDPGLGKTWLLKWQAGGCAAQASQQIHDSIDLRSIVVPVYLRLTDIATSLDTLAERRKHGTADMATLAEAVIECLLGLSNRMQHFIREKLGTSQCLLLLDALDEVPAEQRTTLLAALRGYVDQNPQSRVLLTSRVVGYTQPWNVPSDSDVERELEVLPFDDVQIGIFIDAFFADAPNYARKMLALLQYAHQLRGMAQIPLLLGFLCALFGEEQKKPQVLQWDFANVRRSDLYAACLNRLFSGTWRERPMLLSDGAMDTKLELLEQVAFRLFQHDREQFSMRELRRVMQDAYLYLNNSRLSENEQMAKLREWTEQDGILVKASAGENPLYLFLHLTFQEYLTACALANEINGSSSHLLADVWAFVDAKAWHPRWEEVIILLAGRLYDPIPLLERLMDKDKDDMFRHRLCLAARLLPALSISGKRGIGSEQGRRNHLDKMGHFAIKIEREVLELWREYPALRHITRSLTVNTNPQMLVNLIQYLKDPAQEVRYAAARVLEQMGSAAATSEVLAVLVQYLKDPEEDVRIITAHTLGGMGSAAATSDVLAVLVQYLKDHDWKVRYATARVLRKMGNAVATSEVLAALVQCLKDSAEDVRIVVADALGEMGSAAATSEVLAVLVQFLRNSDWRIRSATVDALGKMGGAVATSEVLAALVQCLKDPDQKVRNAAVNAFGHLGSAAATSEVLAVLVQYLKDHDRKVRSTAVIALRKMGSAVATSEVLAVLVQYLKDPDEEVRYAAVGAFGHIGSAAATSEVLAALVLFLRNSDWKMRYTAARVLKKMGSVAATSEVLTSLVQCLKDSAEDVRIVVADALGEMGSAVATSEVLTVLIQYLKDHDWIVRNAAVNALQKMGSAIATSEVLAVLVQYLKDHDWKVRYAGVNAFGHLGSAAVTSEVVAVLVQYLKGPDEDVRYASAGAFGKLGSAAATSEVLVALVQCLKDSNWKMRSAAADALGKMGSAVATSDVLAALVQCLKDSAEDVRIVVADALGKIGSAAATSEVLAALVQCLKDSAEDVRIVVADALGEMGSAAATSEVLAVLVQYLRDPNEDVHYSALNALEEMGSVAATSEVLTVLIQYLKDRDDEVRYAATDVISRWMTEIDGMRIFKTYNGTVHCRRISSLSGMHG